MTIPRDVQIVSTALQPSQLLAQIKSLAIITGESDGVKLSGAECGQIANNGACRARTAAHPNNLMRGLACLHARLGQTRINVQVLVQKEVAKHGYAGCGKTIDQLTKSRR
jgi:hypothetical protein